MLPSRARLAKSAARPLMAVALGGGILMTPAASRAFCRMTTCDAGGGGGVPCETDSRGCSTSGRPLYWASRCLSFGVQQDGSPRRKVSARDLDAAVSAAFEQWLGAPCDGGAPSFRVWDFGRAYGAIVCARPEYNRDAPNANVWMFRDGDWPYSAPGSTLALTTVTVEMETGRILDADVELNSFGALITTTPGTSGDDLQSIVTHEAGHFLGLGHSDDAVATMFGRYPADQLSARSLSADDQAGICAAYPPGRDAPSCEQAEPSHGFSRYCRPDVAPPASCSLGARSDEQGPGPASRVGLVLLGAATLLRRGRARERRTSAGRSRPA